MTDWKAKGIDSCWSHQASSHCQFLPTQSYCNQNTTSLPSLQQALCPCFPHHLQMSSAAQSPLMSTQNSLNRKEPVKGFSFFGFGLAQSFGTVRWMDSSSNSLLPWRRRDAPTTAPPQHSSALFPDYQCVPIQAAKEKLLRWVTTPLSDFLNKP